ncbi:unnamed protein product, partial [Effrenium voratum]
YVCTWCFEQELRMQDVEEEQTVPVIVRDWKPVLTTDYGVERLRQVPTMRRSQREEVRQDPG